MLKRLWSVLGSIAVVLTLAVPGTAWAQDDEVFVDPNSPAGVEYELPLDRARQEAGAGGGAGNSGSGGGSAGGATAAGEAPLFGEGVGGDRPASDGGGASGPASASTGSSSPPEHARPAVRAQAPSPDDDGGALLAIVAGGGGVLALGALAGLLWRRRSPVGG